MQTSLRLIAARGVPAVFTSFSEDEAEGDARALVAAGLEVSVGPVENPYRCLIPQRDFAGGSAFISSSKFVTCARGHPWRSGHDGTASTSTADAAQ